MAAHRSSGGRGTIGGAIIGACVIGALADGMVMMGVSEFWQMVIKGAVIVGAVVLDQLQLRMSGGGEEMNIMARGGSGNMLAEARRSKILEWIQEEGSARVRDLAAAFSVSEVTVRQDLERLEGDGHVVREHGGAYLKSVQQQVRAMALHHLVNMDKKQRIGRAAAALVSDGETIILDSGSTTTEVAANLIGPRTAYRHHQCAEHRADDGGLPRAKCICRAGISRPRRCR